MPRRDDIDGLLTDFGVIMEDGTECLLSRGLSDADLAVLIDVTSRRIAAMQSVIDRVVTARC